jgi:hypothetical protein
MLLVRREQKHHNQTWHYKQQLKKISTLCKVNICSICCPAHIEASDFVPSSERIIYCDMLEFQLVPHIRTEKPNVIRHDKEPPHIHNEMTRFLKRK